MDSEPGSPIPEKISQKGMCCHDDHWPEVRVVVNAASGDLQRLAQEHGESQKALLAILKEPTFDRSKLESLRVRSVSGLDEASKRLSTAIGDLTDVLSPQQLADSAEKRHRGRAFGMDY